MGIVQRRYQRTPQHHDFKNEKQTIHFGLALGIEQLNCLEL
jgi:hypothetical protein